jgi:N-acetylglutamate synthase-like GNAT family acetyltransferase
MNTPIIRSAVLKDAEQIFELIREHKEDLISRPMGDIIQNIDRFFVADVGGDCGRLCCLPDSP